VPDSPEGGERPAALVHEFGTLAEPSVPPRLGRANHHKEVRKTVKKTYRHTGVLFMVAVIGLAVIGLGYALWFQVLTLNGTVSTGNLDVEWSDHGTLETYSTTLGETWVESDDPEFIAGKATQICEQVLEEDGHVLTIRDAGLYPYAGCIHDVNIHNNGTVPVHIDLGNLELSDLACDTEGCDAEEDINVEVDLESCVFEGNPEPPGEFVGDTSVVQLHPSNELRCLIRITANQSANENTTYSGGIQLLACQWNEDVNCTFENTGGRENNETPVPTATPEPTPTPTLEPL